MAQPNKIPKIKHMPQRTTGLKLKNFSFVIINVILSIKREFVNLNKLNVISCLLELTDFPQAQLNEKFFKSYCKNK